jgi:hypothetical protein
MDRVERRPDLGHTMTTDIPRFTIDMRGDEFKEIAARVTPDLTVEFIRHEKPTRPDYYLSPREVERREARGEKITGRGGDGKIVTWTIEISIDGVKWGNYFWDYEYKTLKSAKADADTIVGHAVNEIWASIWDYRDVTEFGIAFLTHGGVDASRVELYVDYLARIEAEDRFAWKGTG